MTPNKNDCPSKRSRAKKRLATTSLACYHP